jgi:Na+/proline symporter/signal transduction histidine kinase
LIKIVEIMNIDLVKNNMDLWIVLAYLAFTLFMGLRYSKGVTNIQTFALGGRNFSTSALAATITATYVSGSSFIVGINQGYQDGLLKFFSSVGIVLNILTMVYILIPRMSEFLGDISISTSMRKLFNRDIGIIVGVFGAAIPICMVAMQIKILASSFGYFIGIDPTIAALLCAFVMIAYAMSGGIRAVIATDILQFVTFMIVVPAIGIGIWSKLSENQEINAAQEIYKHAAALKSVSGNDYLTVFLLFLLPGFTQSSFQRITASRGVAQATSAFKYSAYIYLVYVFIAALVGMMLFVYHPGLSKPEIFPFMLDQFTFPGLRGLVFIAIIAMAMSTADSELNSFGVIFGHDICKQLGLAKTNEAELRLARLSTIFLGTVAAAVAVYFQDLVQLLLFMSNFYEPVVSPAFVLAILGFRSSSRAVLIGIAAGFGTVVIWKLIQVFYPDFLTMDSLIPAVSMNFLSYFAAHYLLGEPGGWVGPKDTAPVEIAQIARKKQLQNFFDQVTGVFKTILWKEGNLAIDTKPMMRSLLGVLILASYAVVTISEPNITTSKHYIYVLQFFSYAIGALLIVTPLWASENGKYAENITLYSLIYLVFSNFLLMLAHSFSNISIVSFLASSFAVAFFGRVLITILVVLTGSLASYILFALRDNTGLQFAESDFTLVLAYIAFAMSFVLLPFMSRKQTEISDLTLSLSELTHMNNVLQSRIAMKDEKIATALDIRPDLLRNINHEVRTPINTLDIQTEFMIQRANEQKGTIPPDLMRIMTSVRDASVRAYKYISNMLDLSLYQKSNMLFDIKPHNFKEFLEKLFAHKENILLKYGHDAPEIIEFDEVKMKELFEHIISNSEEVMKQKEKVDSDYSANDIITVSVTKTDKIHLNNQDWEQIEIHVKDSGIGIPDAELKTIFEPFYISSRTKSPSGGRGMGLSLALEIIRMHNGDITAANNADVGVTMSVILPISHPCGDFLIRETEQEEENVATDLIQIVSDVDRVKGRFFGRVPKVLMIDDERSIRDSGDLMITSMCYEFMAIATGEEAVEYIMSKEFNADIVLLDMMLGDTTGLEVMKKVGAKLASLGVPVIIQSGLLAGDPNIQETLALGAKTLISKPYKRKDFQEKVKEYLGLSD